jgi:hypothetical protein
MGKLLELLSMADGKKTYLMSAGLLLVGCYMCCYGNAEMGAMLIGMSGLGASLRSAIGKQPQ